MELIKFELESPKEIMEVVQAIVGIVADIKAKKELPVLAAENLPALLKAFEGADQIPAEIKDAHAVNAAMYLASQLIAVLKA